MKSLSLLLAAAVMAVIWMPPQAMAQATATEISNGSAPELGADQAPQPPGPHQAGEVSFEAQRYVTRPLVLFADSPDDLNFNRQLSLVQAGLADLAIRDVIVILDTNPVEMTEWRRNLRPRGFSLVQLDKDLTPVFRKPLTWSIREIVRSIDKLESRRQEIAERFPGR